MVPATSSAGTGRLFAAAARTEFMAAENEIPHADLRNALDAMRDPFLTCASIRADDGTITGFRVLFANRARCDRRRTLARAAA